MSHPVVYLYPMPEATTRGEILFAEPEEYSRQLDHILNRTGGLAGRILPLSKRKRPDGFGNFGRLIPLDYPSAGLLRIRAVLAASDRQRRLILDDTFPYATEGEPNVLTLTRAVPCRDGGGGFDAKSEGGANFHFHCADFDAISPTLKLGKKYRVKLAALAYRVGDLKEKVLTIKEGPLLEMTRRELLAKNPKADVSKMTEVKVRLAGARAYEQVGNYEDDLRITSVIESVRRVRAFDRAYRRLALTFCLPDDKPVRCAVYAGDHVLEHGYAPRKGRTISTFVWMQGIILGLA